MSAEIKVKVSDSLGRDEVLLIPGISFDEMVALLGAPGKLREYAKRCCLIKNVSEASDVNS